MKLRLRSLETKDTHKLEVPTPCSIQQLRQLLLQKIAAASPSTSIQFSLNRKDDLFASPDESLQSLGVTSGDLIFFTLNPNGFSSQNPQIADRNHRKEVNSEALDLDTQKEKIRDLSTQMREEQQILDSENTQKGKTVDWDTQMGEKQRTLESEYTQKGKTLDLDTQMGGNADDMVIDDDWSELAIGKAFSVPGFLRKVFTEELGDDGGRHHKLLVTAVHAVLLESGFIRVDPVSNTVVNGFHLPKEWPLSVFRMSLLYTLPDIVGHSHVSGDKIATVVLKFQSLGKYLNVYGSLGNGSGTHWMRVDEDRLVPFLNVVWANCGLVDDTNAHHYLSSTSPEREVFTFWRNVKDKIALPLLIDLCEKAGMGLPPCFMQLPTDLKLRIVELLPGVDVAKLSYLCSELRYLTSSDDLWKRKYVEYFGDDGGSEGGSHWKKKFADRFAKSVESRKKMKVISVPFSRQRRDYFPRRFPTPALPGVIGGDYDLWPNLGPVAPFGQPGRALPRFRNHVPRCVIE
ncbi:hypothetical protein RJ640_018611 [Escallonia rubra]|uniref:F-box domain-containing protein n=1 Tax=Escallonia rubra TaxID=112253 RepID=A0AA88QP56_9ASTE|nr:hypothetical protein RJ640_018611 [Escallonia rubra]